MVALQVGCGRTAVSVPELGGFVGEVRNGLVLAYHGDEWVLERRTLQLRDATAAHLGHGGQGPRGGQVLDASDCIVMPGFVNAHYHSHDLLLRGLGTPAPLEIWSIGLAGRRKGFGPREHYVSAILGSLELLSSGCTTVVDHVRTTPPADPECLAAVAQAYEEVGIRAVVVPVISDRRFADTLPLGESAEVEAGLNDVPPAASVQLRNVDEFARAAEGRGQSRIRVAIGPSAPQRCTDDLLVEASEWARDRGTFVHTHVLETKLQRAQARRVYGQPMVRHLADLGILTEAMQLVHMVWPTAEELQLAAEHGATVIHCPVANAFLGSGVAPLPRMHALGMRVAFGTDSPACNGSTNMFETLKWAHVAQMRRDQADGPSLTGSAVLAMATLSSPVMASTATAGLLRGSGQLADLVMLDARSPGLTPLNSPAQQVVDGLGPHGVVSVLVDGVLVYHRGSALVNPEPLRNEAASMAGGLPFPGPADAARRAVRAAYRRIAAVEDIR